MNAFVIVLPGVLVALGVLAVATAFRPRHPRLADALAALDGGPIAERGEDAVGAERLGAAWIRARRVSVTPDLERQLRLSGRTLTRHYTLKVGLALAGLLLPLVVGIVAWFATGTIPALPALLSLVLAVMGFIAPDLLLRGRDGAASEDATESLLTFFDLVTLERLANQSGTQALHAAASLSDAPVFVAIRGALDRARLQQRAPFGDLKELGRELELPALVDLSDVMRLDEAGASLSTALRARVRELRDAHLTAMKVAATDVSERMTLWMVVPSLVLGLFFLVPPLLTLTSNG